MFGLLLSLVLISVRSKVTILPGSGCRALERVGGALTIQSQDSFLVSLSLGFEVPNGLLTEYEKTDNNGKNCLIAMKDKFATIFESFENKIVELRKDRDILNIYLTDEQFLGKAKRVSGSVIFAILSAFANVFATALGVVTSVSNKNNIDARLNLLSSLNVNQRVAQRNVKMLYEKNEFIGMQKNLMLDHINLIANVHSCDILSLNFDTQLLRYENNLEKIASALYSGNLDDSILSHETLREIMQQSFFDNTIFEVSPSLFYKFAKIEIVSLENGHLTIMINFPRIIRQFDYDFVNIISTHSQIEYVQSESFDSFLIPHSLNLSSIAHHKDEIKSSAHCINHFSFKACPINSLQSNIFDTLFFDSNATQVKNDLKKRDFAIQLFKSGALVQFKKDVLIEDENSKVLFEVNDTVESMCVFVPRRKGIVLHANNRKKVLFPSSKLVRFDVKPRFRIEKVQHTKIENLTLPTFKPIVLEPEIRYETRYETPVIDYVYIITITCAFSTALIMIILFIYLATKCCTFDMTRLFPFK